MAVALTAVMDGVAFALSLAAYFPAPLQTRAVLLAVAALAAIASGLTGNYPACALSLAACVIDVYRALEVRRMTAGITAEISEQRTLAALTPYMSPRTFTAGESIFTRGDQGTSLYYLIEGKVMIPEVNQQIRPGQLFGEIALFTRDHCRTAGARAETQVRLLEMSSEDFIAAVRRNPDLGFYFIVLITARLTHDFSYVNELFSSAEAQRQQLFVLATRDGLTGVANRRSFDDRINLEWAHSLRNRRPISLIMFDIDHFKQYNDNYGHQAGDVALKSVAQAMSKCLMRRGDLFARYGGEEFAAILTGNNFDAALRMAETMRSTVASLQIPHAHNEGGILTVSAGVTTLYPDRTLQMSQLVETADECLYRAKAAGRNRVEGTAVGVPDDAAPTRVSA